MIYVKTELGKTALQDKSLGLSPKQRSAFIMFDGKRTAADVLKLTSALGITADDIDRLQSLGLLAPVSSSASVAAYPAASHDAESPAAPVKSSSVPSLPPLSAADDDAVASSQSQYAKAYLVAVRLTGGLGLRGFRLNLAVESARDLEALKDLGPKIKEAVGLAKFKELEDALYR